MSQRGWPRWAPRSPFASGWVAVFCAMAALATWMVFPPETVEAVMGETGPVERLTAATYALCALLIWWARGRGDDLRTVAAVCVVMLAFCARELDWHRSFTGTSVLRLSWYAGPSAIGAKALAAAILLIVLAALAWLLLRHARSVVQGWWARRPVALTLGMFIVMLVAAKSLDRSVSILVEDLHVAVPLQWKALRTAFEEWFELGLSMLVVLALVQHRAERHRG